MNDTSAYQPYVEASWGLTNHWYPALFSRELGDDGLVGIQIAGVPILLRRLDGTVHALRDECVHRGVKLSLQPTCLTADTVTCWYHGFTYRLADGELSAIAVSPEDPLIGTVGLQTYPVAERNGLVFVFVGDADYGPPPPLEADLPPLVDRSHRHWSPHVLDDDAVVLGIRRRVRSNWRLGCENGFDPGHIFIHRNTTLVRVQSWNLPLGMRPVGPAAVTWLEDDADGPHGVRNEFGTDAYLPVNEHEELGLAPLGEGVPAGSRTSMWMPCCLQVENFPQRGLAQFEFYVPVDDQTHDYWELIVAHCPTDADRAAFQRDYDDVWEPLGIYGFNDCDIFAREAMEPFYRHGGGFPAEVLCATDVMTVAWRQLVSRHNRGVARPGRPVAPDPVPPPSYRPAS